MASKARPRGMPTPRPMAVLWLLEEEGLGVGEAAWAAAPVGAGELDVDAVCWETPTLLVTVFALGAAAVVVGCA